ncbi:hypothetical protein [Lutibacter sp. Hel_I_33_5]|uniref:hypothetical protein n=1 Tax=Lutibacter sp. Hel_I_33_5 TaxID=1566289 RepID=UPI0011A89AE9|nr:hypothetical protein [Lutibacter sp. Hel_I_33_5]
MTIVCAVLMIISSCTDDVLTINSASKRINYPGIRTVEPFIKFTIQFKAKTSFTIHQVKLNDTEEIKNFKFYNIEKNVLINSGTEVGKGSYIISFKTMDIKKIDTLDEVFIYAESNNKTLKQKVLIVKNEPLKKR